MRKWLIYQVGRHFAHKYQWWEKYAPYKIVPYEDYMIEKLGLNLIKRHK